MLQVRGFARQTLTEPAERIVTRQQPYPMRARQLLVRIPDLPSLEQHGVIRRPEERTQSEPLGHADRERHVLARRNEALPPDRGGIEQIALFAERRQLRELHQIRPFRIVDVRVHGTHVDRLEFVQRPALDGAELVLVGDAREVEQLETDGFGGHRALQIGGSVNVS